jgi:hypothetical protein
MAVMNVVANGPYPNRLQLVLQYPYVGPLTQDGPLGLFDPARDLQFYCDGALLTVQTSYFDSINNRYLVFMTQAFNLQGFVQVVHHVPNPPFMSLAAFTNPTLYYLSFGEYPSETAGS